MKVLNNQLTLLSEFIKKDLLKIFFWCFGGFVVAGIVGCIAGHFNYDLVSTLMTAFGQAASESGIVNPDGSYSALAFLAHNWSAMLFGACYGFIPFLFLPAVTLLSNGFLVGILASVYMMNGSSMLVFFAGILPHGIFELPALFLSISCGIYLCINLNKLITKNILRKPLTEALSNILRVMLLMVAPMTAIAAFIEAYFTPWFMSLFG